MFSYYLFTNCVLKMHVLSKRLFQLQIMYFYLAFWCV